MEHKCISACVVLEMFPDPTWGRALGARSYGNGLYLLPRPPPTHPYSTCRDFPPGAIAGRSTTHVDVGPKGEF